jgi:hypothetical protein
LVENSLLKLLVVKSIISLEVVFLSKASFSIVYLIKLGSFFLPLIGIGAKKGLSVSTSNLSKGIVLNVSCKSKLFLKVIIPLAEKNALSSISFFENSS